MPLADLETRASPAQAVLSFPDPVVDLAVQPRPIDMEGELGSDFIAVDVDDSDIGNEMPGPRRGVFRPG